MQPRPGTTQRLARFVADTRWQDVPGSARQEAKRALLNFFAVALSGSRTGPVEIALKSLAELTGSRQASVIGRSERVDALSAAFLNAASANVFDFCDTHLPTVIHPTAPLAPALLALSELRIVTGTELLLAFTLGFEIECRIGRVMSPGHYAKGWHIASTCGVFGAAAGAGRLLGLTEQKLVWALGNAATQSSGLCECLGWPAKSISVGNAARNGLWAALLADKGFEGPPEPLAGVQGFFNAMGEPPKWEAITEGWGESWEIMQNSIKPYPCGFVIHPFLDGVLDWRRTHKGARIERIVLTGNPLLGDRTDRPEITTGREAQVSVQHAVAAALVFGRAGVEEFTDACAQNPDVIAIRRKVEVRRDPAIATIAGHIEIWTGDGNKHSLAIAATRGSPANPMTDADIEMKLRTAAATRIAEQQTQLLIDGVWGLEACQDASALARLAVPERS